MVCLGNICRSPLAEGILKQKALDASLNWQIESAGTLNFNSGLPPHRFSQKVALINGIDINQKRSREFKSEDYLEFDKIYAMSLDVIADIKKIAGPAYDADKTALLLDELFPGENKEVPDPYSGTEPEFHDVYKMIAEACDRIVQKYAAPAK